MLALAFSKGEGASLHFMGGLVTYTKDMKSRVLGVPSSLLQEKTAVCGEVAEAMAIGTWDRARPSQYPSPELQGRQRTRMEIPWVWSTAALHKGGRPQTHQVAVSARQTRSDYRHRMHRGPPAASVVLLFVNIHEPS